MENGLYKVRFETSRGAGTGVVALQDGNLRGGDSSMFYHGTCTIAEGSFSGDLVTNVHTIAPHKPSLFGRDIVHIHFEGTYVHDSALIKGHAREVPEVDFKATLTRLTD